MYHVWKNVLSSGLKKSICIPGQKEISFVQTVILVPGGRNEIFGWPGHGYLKTVICIFSPTKILLYLCNMYWKNVLSSE